MTFISFYNIGKLTKLVKISLASLKNSYIVAYLLKLN
jgi:hypothetical protein